MQLLLGDAPPFLKWITVVNREISQKVATIEVDGLTQTGQTGRTGRQLSMGMGCTLCEQPRENRHIYADRRGRIELHRLARDQ